LRSRAHRRSVQPDELEERGNVGLERHAACVCGRSGPGRAAPDAVRREGSLLDLGFRFLAEDRRLACPPFLFYGIAPNPLTLFAVRGFSRAWHSCVCCATKLRSFLGGRVYAIIRSGGKQYRVSEGDVVSVERDVLGSADQDKVTFGEVLMIGGDQPKVGTPSVKGASVAATVLREERGDKIIVFKKKRRKNHTKRKHGHRQDVVTIRIDSINV